MGKRQIGELNPHELVITIIVSQTASIPLEENSMPLANSIAPLLVFVSLEIIMSVVSMKSLTFRNILQGKPIMIIKDGKINQSLLRKLRFTVDDLVDSLRQKDIFDLNEIQDAVIETNGSVSVLKKSEKNALTPSDIGISTDEKSTPVAVVIDGKSVSEYFGSEKINNSEIELLVKSNDTEINKIMLLTVDSAGNTFLVPKERQK